MPNAQGGAPTAKKFEQCLRHCPDCGLALSNSTKTPRWIFRDYRQNVPEEVRDGLEAAVGRAVKSAKSKPGQMASESSEDALTWTVVRHLELQGALATAASELGLLQRLAASPTVLFWGRESPGTGNEVIGNVLAEISERLGEQKNHRTEPDVILDFGSSGVVFFEAKLSSSNDEKDGSDNRWDKYVVDTPAFRDPGAARGTRLYQLARNWRFAYELADGRPFSLVNLVASKQGDALGPFVGSLATTDARQFREVTWAELVAAGGSSPLWLMDYLRERGISLRT